MVKTEQGSDVEQRGHEGWQPTSRPRRTRVVLAATLASVLVLGVGGGAAFAWNSGQNERLAAARSAYSAADAANVEARATASAALEASEGRVADDQVRADLGELLSPRGPFQTNGSSRAEKTSALGSATEATEAETAEIVAATAAVVDAQAAWELEQAQAGYEAAHAELVTALDAGAGVLAGSEGKVADNAVRQTLSDAITAGEVWRNASAGADVDGIASATGRVAEATAAVKTATAATSEAQAAWQAEQDRIAAEQAAAAQAAAAQSAAKSSTAKSSTSSGKKSTPSKSSSSGRTSGSSSAPATSGGSSGGSSSGGGWVVEEQTPMRDRCGDEHGNTWDC